MSIGNKFGRALGFLGAYAVEGAVRGANAAGQFGKDALEGAETGYADKHAELLVSRAAGIARRDAMLATRRAELQAQHAAVMATAPDAPVVVVAKKRAAKAAA